MGQYWIPVNIDKREYVMPHKLGVGLKLWEQICVDHGTTTALFILTAAMPEPRGGGDFEPHPAIGRWAGDRVAVVGDYAEDDDIPNSEIPASVIYTLCHSKAELADSVKYWEELVAKADDEDAEFVKKLQAKIAYVKKCKKPFTDVSKTVCDAIEKIVGGKYTGTGWRHFVRKEHTRV
jgi:hypothetical protein